MRLKKLKYRGIPDWPLDNEVLVKVEACGVCHSDNVVQNNAFGIGFPLTPGHEVIGRVAAVGEGVEAWKVGDRIGAGWHGGHDACKSGLFQMCDNEAINGVTKNGGYAEYVLIRSEAAVKVPDDIDAAKCHALALRWLAVQGLGGLGHLAVQYADKFGYRVVAISRGADKEQFASQLGAHEHIDTSKVDAGAALIVTTNPNAEQIPGLLNGLAPMGKLLVSSLPGEVTFNANLMTQKGLSIHAWPAGHSTDIEETVKFSQLQDVDCMIQKFPLGKVNEAYDAMLNGSVRFRAVISFE
ncbi:hypothetical protein C8A00DRAFT_42800 [Chaetomidium leptoderma]|uniref:Alcohol dehydrogenase n=1 Tax=Chaetomidium leptoderma TaxID=669021 RepID=A0AAN6VMQ7_9PEZI|nr:hypothetical protein C8A00DRAFT_42800 [Chaetomidium leptoderma]